MNNAESQAKAQLESIVNMVAALECDYARLEELKDERESLNDDINQADTDSGAHITRSTLLREWMDENGEELQELITAAGDCDGEDDARQRIQEDPLSVEVREDWKNPGEESSPSEFKILLCTGGPAVRIMGDLDEYMQPCRAYIQYQDWGTPWTDYVGHGCNSSLLAYCQQFYFGE